jgi:transcriptional regulator with XRE-family HTH domain
VSTKSLAKVIGENIASRRRELGLTQMVLAERLGIGQDALSRMEKGMISPKVARLRDFAAILNCSVPSLFREDNDDAGAYLAELRDLLLPLEQQKREVLIRMMREIIKIASQ